MNRTRHRFDAATRFLSRAPSRREVLRGLAGARLALGSARPPAASGAKRRKPRRRKGLCQRNGAACRAPGRSCQKRYCLRAPFTIEAAWTETADHDTFLWVPKETAATGPSPYVHYPCTRNTSRCDEAYPFACSSGGVSTTGAEVTTIYQVLPGTYEFWVEIDDPAPQAAISVVLRNSGGRVVRRWASPANLTQGRQSWHVFDVDGRHGRVTKVDELIDARIFATKAPSTNVCPRTT